MFPLVPVEPLDELVAGVEDDVRGQRHLPHALKCVVSELHGALVAQLVQDPVLNLGNAALSVLRKTHVNQLSQPTRHDTAWMEKDATYDEVEVEPARNNTEQPQS